jgi:hypothetical protein
MGKPDFLPLRLGALGDAHKACPMANCEEQPAVLASACLRPFFEVLGELLE